jgi:hypothetical protein
MELMEWTELLGNLGEFIGSLAVMVTLVILVVQVRQSARAVEESNRLQRAAAIDRHSDTVGRWRSEIASNPELARIWLDARADKPLDATAHMRLSFLWINFVNLQRSNYIRAHSANEPGLARQSVLAVAVEVSRCTVFRHEWELVRPWNSLASEEFAREVDEAIAEYARGEHRDYQVAGQPLLEPARDEV